MSLGSIGIYGSRSIRPLSASTPCDKKREASVHNSQRVGHTAKAANAESATDGCERASTSSNARTIEFWSVHTALGARDALESVCGSQTAERTVQAIRRHRRQAVCKKHHTAHGGATASTADADRVQDTVMAAQGGRRSSQHRANELESNFSSDGMARKCRRAGTR